MVGSNFLLMSLNQVTAMVVLPNILRELSCAGGKSSYEVAN